MLDPLQQRSALDIVPWNASFETGIAVIDEQHRKLVSLLNELAHQYVYGPEMGEIERILDALIDYAGYHFDTEEALWSEILSGDPWLEGHLKTHRGFVDKVRAMHSAIKADNKGRALDDLLSFLTGWLAHHILYEDKRFSLVFLQVQDGVGLDTAKQKALDDMMGQTSGLIHSVLSMYKELSSRTLALEREAHARKTAQQALLEQEDHWKTVLGVSSDTFWDLDFNTANLTGKDPVLPKNRFAPSAFTIHPDDWPVLEQAFLSHVLGQSDVFSHQYRIVDASGSERWIQSRGQIIEHGSSDGGLSRIVGTQTDITERKVEAFALKRERDSRTLISEFAADFMASSSEDFDSAINHALQRSGEYMQADRTYVFLVSDDGLNMNNTHEWCAPGVVPEMENLQGIPSDTLPWWWSQFRDIGYVLVPRVDDMPAEAGTEQGILQAQNIQSVCVYPIRMNNEVVGFLGNDSMARERNWGPEVLEFLGLMSDLLGIALGHRELHQKRALAISQLERAERQAGLGHWNVEIATRRTKWSKEMLRMFGRDEESLSPELNELMDTIHPDDRQRFWSTYQEAKSTLSSLHIEHKVVLKGGITKHVEIRGQFQADSSGNPVMVEGTIQDVTEKVQHRESLQRLAFEDPLTGLPNRRSAEDTLLREMSYCESHNLRLVLALLDLDNFREMNEQHGHTLGDRLLKELAQRLRVLFGNAVVVARVGGDEFLVLFTRLQPDENYFQKINRLLAIISKPFTLEDAEICITASIGVTEFPQPIDVMGEQLIRQAQQALFQSKLDGKGRFQAYDIGWEQGARALTDQLKQIREALHAGEFVLHYQPKVHMSTGVVFGAEALVRWEKSTGELVPPGEFLPALHNHPLEIELGDWVIRTALAQMRVWKQQGLHLQVSVNVSGQQVFDGSFVDKLSRDLSSYADIPPSELQLEILESSALNDMVAVSQVMQQTLKLGVSFALDDFGTGYSSLAYLKHLPASVLKIDQGFVRGMMESADDLSIISGVVGMAKAFGLQVIAEGIETIEHGSLLLKLGCDQGQGYGIARPMPAEDLPDWVGSWTADASWRRQGPVDVLQLPIIYAEVEHRRWVKDLEQWLCDEIDSAPQLDCEMCKTGIWIAGDGKRRFGARPEFPIATDLHCKLHQLAQHAVALHAQGNSASAFALLPEIQEHRDLFLKELNALVVQSNDHAGHACNKLD